MRFFPTWLKVVSALSALTILYTLWGGMTDPTFPLWGSWAGLAVMLVWFFTWFGWKAWDDLTQWKRVARDGIYEFYISKKDPRRRRYSTVQVQKLKPFQVAWLNGETDLIETDEGIDRTDLG